MIFNFNQYSMNEASRSSVENVEDLFQTDLMQQEFMHKIFGKNEFVWSEDYEMDNDTERSSTGTEKIVWIEVFNAPDAQIDAISKDYNAFLSPFSAWAKSHNLYDPEVTTPVPNEKNSIIFKVTI